MLTVAFEWLKTKPFNLTEAPLITLLVATQLAAVGKIPMKTRMQLRKALLEQAYSDPPQTRSLFHKS
jgi:hypothetical protein